MITSMSANQNVGTAMKNSVINMVALSKVEYCLTAEMMPTGIPIITAKIIPEDASINVFQNLAAIMLVTACPVL